MWGEIMEEARDAMCGDCERMDEEQALEYAEEVLCDKCRKVMRLEAEVYTWKTLAQARFKKMVAARQRVKELENEN